MRYSTLLIASLLIVSAMSACTNYWSECSDECVTAGFLQVSANASAGCAVKEDCPNLLCGGTSPVQACLLLGYVPNPTAGNDLNKCIAPAFTDCTKANNQACRTNLHQCMATLQLIQDGSTGNCILPNDAACIAPSNGLCKVATGYCSAVLGYKKSTNDCVIVPDADCASTPFCKDPKSYCVVTGKFTQGANSVCTFNDAKCVTASSTYCSSNSHPCVTDLGFAKGSSSDLCVAPADCKLASAALCSTKKTYCKARGYTKATSTDDCVCDTSTKTDTANSCTTKSTTPADTNAMLIKSSLVLLIAAFLF